MPVPLAPRVTLADDEQSRLAAIDAPVPRRSLRLSLSAHPTGRGAG